MADVPDKAVEADPIPHDKPFKLYPHGGGREWSTKRWDDWKDDLAIEVVRVDALASTREELVAMQGWFAEYEQRVKELSDYDRAAIAKARAALDAMGDAV